MSHTKLVGFVQTERREDAGRVVFTLCDDKGNLTPCSSGAGYKPVKPRKGQRVSLVGERKTDFSTGEQLPEFVFYSLEVIKGQPELA